ncbi:MAG: hypothetical protein ACYCYF_07960 [Anaerolineae bacterium]
MARFAQSVRSGDHASAMLGDPLEVPRILEAARTSLTAGGVVAVTR